jgi:hypothetical protein
MTSQGLLWDTQRSRLVIMLQDDGLDTLSPTSCPMTLMAAG